MVIDIFWDESGTNAVVLTENEKMFRCILPYSGNYTIIDYFSKVKQLFEDNEDVFEEYFGEIRL